MYNGGPEDNPPVALPLTAGRKWTKMHSWIVMVLRCRLWVS